MLIGDSVEARAVSNTFGESGVFIGSVNPLFRYSERWSQYCSGSVFKVKSNVGHSEGAAGIISAMKAIFALQKKIIALNISFRELHPRSEWLLVWSCVAADFCPQSHCIAVWGQLLSRPAAALFQLITQIPSVDLPASIWGIIYRH